MTVTRPQVGVCAICRRPLDDHNWYSKGVGRWLDWPDKCPGEESG